MKKLAFIATGAAFALAACGSSTDASEEAMADTVEVPADDAMADAPEPIEDANAMTEEEIDESMAEVEADAEAAGDAAQSVADAAMEAQAEMDAAAE